MCPHQKITKRKGFMTKYLFTKIVERDLVRGQYVELYNFGEPFLHPRLEEFCTILTEKYVRVLISTNASVGHHKIEEILSNETVKLLVCLESLDSGVYKAMTGGHLGRVLDFLDQAKEHRLYGDQVTILVVETSMNRGHSDSIRRVYGEDFPVVRRLSDSFGGSVNDDLVFDGEGDQPVRRLPCVYPFVNCAVDWDGSVGWCCFDYNVDGPYGYLDKNSLHNHPDV